MRFLKLMLSLGLLAVSGNSVALAQETVVVAQRTATQKAESKAKADSQAESKTVQWAEIELSGMLPEGPSLPGLFGEISETMNKLFERLDQAATDENIDGIVLRIENPVVGMGNIHELRTKILQVRKSSGKPVYAWLETAMTSDYLIATACDKIYMPEPGLLIMTGLRAEVSFYKNMLEMLDIKADVLRVGKFKSAAEPYTRTEMSPEFREEVEEMLDDQFEYIIGLVSKARGLTAEQVEEAIDNGPHTPSSALKYGLIDDVRYADELDEIVLAEDSDSKFKLAQRYGKKKVDTDFDGFTGMMKMMNLMMGVEPKSRASKSAQVAVIYASGAIMTGSGGASLLGGEVIGSDSLIKTINEAAANDRVKAIVLRVNSPGGSATASDLIWRALENVDKPVVVSMGNVAASGGYYISMGADYIYAEPATITGSIGVVGGKVALDGLFEKFGVTTSYVGRGKNAGALSIMTPFSDSERIAMQNMMNEIYEIFTRKAAAGRDMPLEKLKSLAGGRIYTGRKAVENGLVDEIGTLDQAVKKAAELANLENSETIDRLLLPKPTSPFEQLFGPIDASTRSQIAAQTVNELVPEKLAQAMRHLKLIEKLTSSEPRLLLMPFQLEIR